MLFYCAHNKKSLYSSFGLMNALETLTTVLKSSAVHTRLLARLIICCLYPIMADCHTNLLKITTEEMELLLCYIRQPKQPGGLDPTKLLRAASVLYQEFPSQSIPASLVIELIQNLVSLLLQDYDNCIIEGALCLLWTLCHVSEVKHLLWKMDIYSLIHALTSLQQNPCSIVSSPAKAVLWQLGYGSNEGIYNLS